MARKYWLYSHRALRPQAIKKLEKKGDEWIRLAIMYGNKIFIQVNLKRQSYLGKFVFICSMWQPSRTHVKQFQPLNSLRSTFPVAFLGSSSTKTMPPASCLYLALGIFIKIQLKIKKQFITLQDAQRRTPGWLPPSPPMTKYQFHPLREQSGMILHHPKALNIMSNMIQGKCKNNIHIRDNQTQGMILHPPKALNIISNIM